LFWQSLCHGEAKNRGTGGSWIRERAASYWQDKIFKGPDFSKLTCFGRAGTKLIGCDSFGFRYVSATQVWHLGVITVAILQWSAP
jgi:hypothetical protein